MIQIKKYLLIILITLYTVHSLYSMSDDFNYYKEEQKETEEMRNSNLDNNTNSQKLLNHENKKVETNEQKNIDLAIVIAEATIKVDWLGDKSASNRSIVSAQKTAINAAVEHILNSGVMLSDFEIKKSKLLKNYHSYINSYTILTNEKTENAFKTQIEALIDYAAIKKYLLSEGVLNDENIKNSITLTVLDNENNYNNIFSFELDNLLRTNKFYILKNTDTLSNTMTTNSIDNDNILSSKELNILSDFIASEYKSKYAIIGTAIASFVTQIEGTSLYTYKSSIYLDIIDIANMKSIKNIVYQTSGTSDSEEAAYNFVLKKSAKYTADEIIKTINKEIELSKEPREYMLVVEGIGYEDSLLLQKEIKNNIEQVKNVYNYGENNNKQSLVVSYVGDIKTLAVELNVKARNIGFRIIIDNYDETTIYLNAKKR